MQIYIPNLHITGATFDCGKYGSAEVTPIERRECLYDVDVQVSPSYRKSREEAQDVKSIIVEVVGLRLGDWIFNADGTTNIESDIEELYELAYLEY
jgi:hypothetical protein